MSRGGGGERRYARAESLEALKSPQPKGDMVLHPAVPRITGDFIRNNPSFAFPVIYVHDQWLEQQSDLREVMEVRQERQL